jgi:hypothetical protein
LVKKNTSSALHHEVRCVLSWVGLKTEEDVYNLRIEVPSGFHPDIFERLAFSPGIAVWSVGGERIPHIHHGENARGERDILSD